MNIRQIPGDSGAPIVYTPANSIQPGGYPTASLVGIANVTDSNNYQVAWGSKAANINSKFGLSTYTIV